MAAAALQRFIGPAARVTLVESDAIGTVGVGEATIPQIRNFNGFLGFDEAEFLRETKGSIKLGIEFVGWHDPGTAYMHAFGISGRAFGIAPFRHAYVRAKSEGYPRDFGAFSFNETAARAGKYHPEAGGGAIPGLVHAYHFDAGLYAAFLRRFAEGLGVERVEGTIKTVDRNGESGDVTAIELEAGRRIEGDLFIDCTGFRSLLLGRALGVGYEDWTRWLPCDRAVAVPCARSEAFRPYTQSIARKAGWQWRIPLQHRTGNGHVFSSDHLSEDEATQMLLDNLDGEALDEPRTIKFKTGRRGAAWSHNVVALGLSAGFMEPLESTSIHLIQSGIQRLLDFFPSRRGDAEASRRQYNALTDFEWARIRDFLIGHYKLNAREGDPFWDACRDMTIPDTLAEKIALFEETGAIHREHEELFTEEGWQQLLLGQGVMPQSWHPAVDAVPHRDLHGLLDTIAGAFDARAAKLPGHDEYIASLGGREAA
ncbi:tryptophan 7-halogenase [Sphingomicrobium sp. GRR-S6-50]|uniref:Tryptophan 7-halogenase n=2 Tax=Sphingomicrobium sediminis TaxID=2950949 RepID=A0A9X2J1Q2_9SPHN|nr:tryptophan 7-halogenase [Sphingomicrobium sediminis]